MFSQAGESYHKWTAFEVALVNGLSRQEDICNHEDFKVSGCYLES